MAKPIELSNGRKWKSKKFAKQHFKNLLSRYTDGQIIDGFDDHSDLTALLERLDLIITDGPPKIGSGIERFERRMNRGDGWSSSGFWVIRMDKSSTDFSYINAVDGIMKPLSQEFYAACHNSVSKDLIRLKQHHFDKLGNTEGQLKCDVTDLLITFSEAKLCHATPSFNAIVIAFRKSKGWESIIPASTITPSKDQQLSAHFTDPAVSEDFRKVHHGVAVLKIISKSMPIGVKNISADVKRPIRCTQLQD